MKDTMFPMRPRGVAPTLPCPNQIENKEDERFEGKNKYT